MVKREGLERSQHIAGVRRTSLLPDNERSEASTFGRRHQPPAGQLSDSAPRSRLLDAPWSSRRDVRMSRRDSCQGNLRVYATRRYDEAEVQQALDTWLPKLERALTDPLGNLIDAYGKAVREHPEATTMNLDELLRDLRKASEMRNILCHGSWRPPDEHGKSIPFFVNRQKLVCDTAMDNAFLVQVQRNAAELACVIRSDHWERGSRRRDLQRSGVPARDRDSLRVGGRDKLPLVRSVLAVRQDGVHAAAQSGRHA